MKRYLTALLLAYSISMTVLAAWLGARAIVYWKIATVWAGSGGNNQTHEQILANIGGPRSLPGPANETAVLVAGLDPVNIAAVTFLLLLTCLGFASRRGKGSKNSDSKKD